MKFRKEDEHRPNYESYQIVNETTKSIVAHGVPVQYADLIESIPELLESLEGMFESYNILINALPESVAKGVVNGAFLGEPRRAESIIAKAKLKILTVS